MNADVTIRGKAVWLTFHRTPRCRQDVRLLKTRIDEAARAGFYDLVFDLSQLTWVGAAALGALATACRVAGDGGGTVEVAGGCPSINRAIKAAGLDRLLSKRRDPSVRVPEYAA